MKYISITHILLAQNDVALESAVLTICYLKMVISHKLDNGRSEVEKWLVIVLSFKFEKSYRFVARWN